MISLFFHGFDFSFGLNAFFTNQSMRNYIFEAGYLKRFLRGEVMEYFSVFGAPFEHASLDSNDQGLIF